LPAPEMSRGEQGYVAPRTQTEEVIAQVWAEVLKLDRVGIHDNFFELGGHSLLALTVSETIGMQLGISVKIQQLFRSPRLEDFAIDLDNSVKVKSIVWNWGVPNIERRNIVTIFLIHGAGGEIGYFNDLATTLRQQYRVFGIQSPAAVGKCDMPKSLKDLAEYYRLEVLKQMPGPYLLVGWSMGGVIALEMAKKNNQLLQGVVLVDTHRPKKVSIWQELDFERQANEVIKGRISRSGGNQNWDVSPEISVQESNLIGQVSTRLADRIKGDVRLAATFAPGKISCPVYLCEAEEGRAFADRSGLLEVSDQFKAVKRIGGNHFTILNKENASDIAQFISSILTNRSFH
ncbi:thioesterase domain-containing protein, partial [Burkholderia cepacia]|uniref:thioesterase domain-containing protein n=2 Tax=Burkholderia TaxID=32008 RepID=UPI002AB6606D